MRCSQELSQSFDSIDTPYLDSCQLEMFRQKLLDQREKFFVKIKDIKNRMRSLKANQADVLDQSTLLSNLQQEIRFSRRYEDLVSQIDRAVERIDQGNFGYCELTGEEIGLRRLMVQPWATLSIKALESMEKEASRKVRDIPSRSQRFPWFN